MKAALCFIISREHVLYHEALWREWIEPNRDILNIYFHYSDLSRICSPWIRAHTLPPTAVHPTSYYSVVPAYMAILQFAFHHDADNQWFCMLTDACVPIVSPATFRRRFEDHFAASLIRCVPAYWNLTLHQRANLRLLRPKYWLANDPWFTLCRKHVHQCLLFMAGKQGIYELVCKGGLANESLFAIVLQTFHELGNPATHVPHSSTVADWSRMSSPTSPHLFQADQAAMAADKRVIGDLLRANPFALFLRKVHPSFPDDVLREFMTVTDWGHDHTAAAIQLHNMCKKQKEIMTMEMIDWKWEYDVAAAATELDNRTTWITTVVALVLLAWLLETLQQFA